MKPWLLFGALLAGCSGNLSVPNTDIARILQNQEALSKQQREILQSNATLVGKFDTLIELKHKEVEKLGDVKASFDRYGDLLERVLPRPPESSGR